VTGFIPRFIKKAGYSAIRSAGELPANVPGIRHAPVLPQKSTYSPWLTDGEFISAFNSVQSNTLVDKLRCYELWSMVRQSAKLESGALIEVGVWRGGTGCLIARAAGLAGLAEPVYLCDTFSGVVKAGPMDPKYRGGEHADTTREVVEKLAAGMGLKDVVILQGIFPDDTAHAITASSFRFAHIDVDVYESASQVLKYIWPLLVPGGIAVFDDYGAYGCEGVTRLVNEMSDERDRIFIHNANGHGIMVKR
jgi:O-methyltransferase